MELTDYAELHQCLMPDQKIWVDARPAREEFARVNSYFLDQAFDSTVYNPELLEGDEPF